MRLLPLFPLNLVVFPGEKLNLHIFEPRYRQLVADCLDSGQTFGIPPFLDEQVQPIGTEMRLLKVERSYPGGESDIRTQAIGRFRVVDMLRELPTKLYAAGQVEDLPDNSLEDPGLKARISQQVEQLYGALGLQKLFIELAPDYRTFDIAHHLGFSTEQEYELLKLPTEAERQQYVLHHLAHILPVVLETERLKERVRQNGHFKNLTPPNF
ncbi:LON peptidase substrate-binding domain-containing protein [Hymenobacter sp. 15J16-1T3B]|uniref:LON peptidase substrate-binding domain-containing protein n=1 Tax=Hymenobacter sp. 15J16-1T3B TaxID=2886941 RepID=UPI001D1303C9|nr:LON peptidase substrate-binding domain-containing protein [Hymenobacter sp. 15J16-1T3B]MCC3157131.1 LON peptidase substrate-binding domain-containing protein [Hymenobacter sp. 15J16-1T3B]